MALAALLGNAIQSPPGQPAPGQTALSGAPSDPSGQGTVVSASGSSLAPQRSNLGPVPPTIAPQTSAVDPNDPVLNAALRAHIDQQDPNGLLKALASAKPAAALAKIGQQSQVPKMDPASAPSSSIGGAPVPAPWIGVLPTPPAPSPTAPAPRPAPGAPASPAGGAAPGPDKFGPFVHDAKSGQAYDTGQAWMDAFFGTPAATPPTRDNRDPNAPPTRDPQIGELMSAATALRERAADLTPPRYPGMTPLQALVGIAGAMATYRNPHAQFIANYMPALGQAVERQYGSSMQGFEVARQGMLDMANSLQQRAMGIQGWQEDIYKAQMGVYGQQLRGVGAAEVRADGKPGPAYPSQAVPAQPSGASAPDAARKGLVAARGVPGEVAAPYLSAVSRLPDAEAASWAGNQAVADQLIAQAGKAATPVPKGQFDLGRALFTANSLGSVAQSIRSQVPALRAARMALVAQRGAVDPASDAARNLQAGIDQYDQAIQASGAKLDRLAGASQQISVEIKRQNAFLVRPPDPAGPPIPGARLSVSPLPGANAVNQANASLRYVGGHDLNQPAPGIQREDGTPATGNDLMTRANQAIATGRDPVTGAPVTRDQVIDRLRAIGYTVE